MTFRYITPAFWFPMARLMSNDAITPSTEYRLARASSKYNEEKQVYELTIELPGVSKEAIEVSALNNELIISTKKETENQRPQFYRKFFFDTKIDTSTIKATYTNGLLDIEVKPEVPAKVSIKVD